MNSDNLNDLVEGARQETSRTIFTGGMQSEAESTVVAENNKNWIVINSRDEHECLCWVI
jgi:hypothetical protein